jgi:hypothetical protein
MSILTRIFGRIREFWTTQSDVLSQTVRVVTRRYRSISYAPTHDWARSDYAFWRRAYFCKVRGLEISGLFIKPLVNKIAGWTLGIPPSWRVSGVGRQSPSGVDDASAQALNDWWAAHQGDILAAYRASLKEGDAFAVVNPDLTITLPPPETVDPIVAEDDYSRVVGWRITQVYAHPERQDRMTRVDEYYPDRRVQRVEVNGVTRSEQVFPNLLGRAPVVHIANAPQEGETFGHAEAEALIEVLQRYGEIFEAAIEGNITQGRPTPVASFETIQDLDKFWELYGSSDTERLPDGTSETTTRLDVDLSQLLTLSGAAFDYKAPGSFTQDTERLLGLMFYLILEHTELPEFVFGNAIASSKASAEVQMPVFERVIEQRRAEATPWLIELAAVVLGYLALTEPGVTAGSEPSLQWRKLTQDGLLTLQTLQWAYTEGLLDERTALMLAPLDVADIDEVLEAARAEREAHPEGSRPPAGPAPEPEMDEELRAEIENLEV